MHFPKKKFENKYLLFRAAINEEAKEIIFLNFDYSLLLILFIDSSGKNERIKKTL